MTTTLNYPLAPAPAAAPAAPIAPTAVEEVPAGEAHAIATMMAELKRQLEERYVAHRAVVRRDAHPKIVGLVKASFAVHPKCPAELRHGVFGRQETFDAEIRFSNGAPIIRHDLAIDVRGMAIKLPDVKDELLREGGQDFLLATGEAFFGSDAVDYADFPAASVSPIKTVWYFIRGRRWRAWLRSVQGHVSPAIPFDNEYFSQTPYRLGPHCVKYSARPLVARKAADTPWYLRRGIRMIVGIVARLFPRLLPKSIPERPLRELLIRELAGGPVTMELLVQRWPDLSRLPAWAIEDATRTWPLPWIPVATIDIHQQRGIEQRDAIAERMSFNPWHGLREHQPLGSINRARLAVYKEMSAFRNAHNRERKAAV